MTTTELPAWRRHAAAAVQALPAPARRQVWRGRRAAARAQRRRLEKRGDWSQSMPANHGMDARLDEIIGRTGGFFVEAGGYDGYTQSNTYFLERARGWRGVLVEPTPILADEARRERPASTIVQCGLVAPDFPDETLTLRYGGSKTVVEVPDAHDWVSDAQENQALDQPEHVFEVPARTLTSVLEELGAPEIDLITLDVEGYEPQILRGLDLDRYAPRYLLIEVDMRAERREVEDVLGERYRQLEALSPNDMLYERVSALP